MLQARHSQVGSGLRNPPELRPFCARPKRHRTLIKRAPSLHHHWTVVFPFKGSGGARQEDEHLGNNLEGGTQDMFNLS